MARTAGNKKSGPKKKAKKAGAAPKRKLECMSCHVVLPRGKKALFVEEEVGRAFCSEKCISEFFAEEVAELEREYLSFRPKEDLVIDDTETLHQLKWATLNEPAEVWREAASRGHFRYTLISELDVEGTPGWYVCVCLFLKNEPSFLFIGFGTQSSELVNRFRRTERYTWEAPLSERPADPASDLHSDRLASEWTDEETFRAELTSHRRDDDIPVEEFEEYQHCIEETLDRPTEIWSTHEKELAQVSSEEEDSEAALAEGPAVFHFIRKYTSPKKTYWFVLVAREVEESDQLEVLEAFPTRDPGMVEICRRGTKQLDESEEALNAKAAPGSTPRVIH